MNLHCRTRINYAIYQVQKSLIFWFERSIFTWSWKPLSHLVVTLHRLIQWNFVLNWHCSYIDCTQGQPKIIIWINLVWFGIPNAQMLHVYEAQSQWAFDPRGYFWGYYNRWTCWLSWSCDQSHLGQDMWFPTMWHFDKCRFRWACAASF